jgi:hypothetical protein
MSPNVHTYYFGRLNLLGKWNDKRTFLREAMASGAVEPKGKFKYGTFSVEDLSINNQTFAYGTLVKYKPLLKGEVVDEQSGQIVEGGLPDGVVAKSEFFLHYQSEVIAYHPTASRLSNRQFRNMFAQLIEAGHDHFFVDVSIELIEEECGIIEAVKRFQVIRRISIEIHPTNPSNRKIYEDIDRRLKDLEAQKLRQSIEGGRDGLNKHALLQDDIYESLVMAADGYGKGNIQGILEGAKVTISTGQSPVTKEVFVSENPKDVLSQLLSAFERIWERKKK